MTLKQIKKQIIPILKKYHVINGYIFGSTSRGTAEPDSDVDLLVSLPTGSSLFELITLQQDLSVRLRRRVDVVTPRSLSPLIRKKIKKDLIRIV